MNQPKVSVIIPVYNTGKYLRECLDSVVDQTLKDIEIVCVDDGSTDNSLSILREYEEKDSRVKVLTQKNQFAGVARNRGMEAASGQYYAFMDADDYFLQDALSKMLMLCERHDLDFIKACFFILEAGKAPHDNQYARNGSVNKNGFRKILSFPDDIDALRAMADVPWNGMYRASFLKENGIEFNHYRVINDHSFFINCIIHAKRAMVMEDHIACHRVNQSTSLVGTKYKYFQCQIDNYFLVRQMVQNLDPSQKRKLLQGEVNGVFYWYNSLYPSADSFYKNQMDRQLRSFIAAFDENDVGLQYLRAIHFLSNNFRGAIQCYWDNGLGYTIRRALYHVGLWKDEEKD